MKPGDEHRFAKDEDGNLVDAKEFNPDERRTRKCYCLSCGDPLIPVLGQKRVKHFRHEADKPCNGETYLHELGKRMLKKRWDESTSFIVVFPQTKTFECSRDCLLKDEHCIRSEYGNPQDLKRFYQTCTIEKKYGDFQADLLLEDKSGKFPPTMLEVCVTHPCSEEKKNSGIRVIEFTVKSEIDAASLYSMTLTKVGNISINFYGIKNTSIVKKVDNLSWRDQYNESIVKAILYETGKIYISYVDCKRIASASADGIATAFFHPSGGWHPVDYIDIPYDEQWYRIRRSHHRKKALAFFAQHGFNIKSCNYCYNLKEATYGDYYFCWSYKRHNTPKYPDPEHAYFCSRYLPDFQEKIPGYLLESPSLQQNPELYKSVPPSPLLDPGSIIETATPTTFAESITAKQAEPQTAPTVVDDQIGSAESLFKKLMNIDHDITDLWAAHYSNEDTRDGKLCLVFTIRSLKYFLNATISVVQKEDGRYAIYGESPGSPEWCISEDCSFSQVVPTIEKSLEEHSNF